MKKNNRLLAFANDAASANMVSAFIYLYNNDFDEILIFGNEVAQKIYLQYLTQYSCNKEFKFNNNDTVITGTSGINSSYEMSIIKKAKLSKVKKIITIVDNISNFNMRFTLDNKILNKEFIPNEIWVFEKGFKSEVSYLNETLVYKENIYFKFLKKLYQTNPPIIKNNFVKRFKHNYLVILSEYLYELYGLHFGFSEYEVVENILEVADELSLNIPVFLKLHPRENKNKYNIFLRKYSHMNITQEECYIQELIYYSKVVLGINSSVFIETKTFNIPTYSIQINSSKNMKLSFLKEENKIFTKKELKKVLYKYFF